MEQQVEIAFVPQWVLNFFSEKKNIQHHINVLLSLILLLLLSSKYITNHVPHFCLAQYLFRMPCPGCGITRSLFALYRFDFRIAWLENPIGPFLGVFLCIQFPARVLAIISKNFERMFVLASSFTSRMLVAGLV